MRRIFDIATAFTVSGTTLTPNTLTATGYDTGISIQSLPWLHWNTEGYDQALLVVMDVSALTLGGGAMRAELRVDTDSNVGSGGKLIAACDILTVGRHFLVAHMGTVKQLLGLGSGGAATYIGTGVVITGGTNPTITYTSYAAQLLGN